MKKRSFAHPNKGELLKKRPSVERRPSIFGGERP
jgi:hypothetical protein